MGVYLRLTVLLAALVVVCLLAAPGPASAATTYTVNSTNDPGDGVCNVAECTLREGITAANGDAALDTIAFNIPGPNPHTITVVSSLPPITQPLYVDGSTQPGFTSAPRIEISGVLAGINGIGLDVQSSDSTIRALSVTNFKSAGIWFNTTFGTGLIAAGNYIGVRPDGLTAGGNYVGLVSDFVTEAQVGGTLPNDGNVISGNSNLYGIWIRNSFTDPDVSFKIIGNHIGTDVTGLIPVPNATGVRTDMTWGLQVGGAAPGEGNVVSFNQGSGLEIGASRALIQANQVTQNYGFGVYVSGSENDVVKNLISGNATGLLTNGSENVIRGNLIGTDATGTAPMPNNFGAILHGFGHVVGGPQPEDANTIAGNLSGGIYTDGSIPFSTPTIIRGNRIGVGLDGVTPIPNGQDGIVVFGPQVLINENTIAHNEAAGIAVHDGIATVGANSIHTNGGLGIDLLDFIGVTPGVTENDPLDADTDGGNNFQNFPEITSVVAGSSGFSISGELHSRPIHEYTIDFYANNECDPSNHGEGQRWIGSTTAMTDAVGDATFTFAGGMYNSGDNLVTATASDSDGNTSEFSACAARQSPVGGTVTLTTSPPASHTSIPYALAALIPALAAGLWLSRRLLRS